MCLYKSYTVQVSQYAAPTQSHHIQIHTLYYQSLVQYKKLPTIRKPHFWLVTLFLGGEEVDTVGVAKELTTGEHMTSVTIMKLGCCLYLAPSQNISFTWYNV